jgi:hypothetical protein
MLILINLFSRGHCFDISDCGSLLLHILDSIVILRVSVCFKTT